MVLDPHVHEAGAPAALGEGGGLVVGPAVAAEPGNTAYRDSLGWVYFRLNRHADAVRELQKAAAGESADGVILEHLGEALLKLDQRDEALAAFRRAEAAFQKAGKANKLEGVRKKIAETE